MIWTQIFKQLCEVCKKIGELASSISDMPQIEGLALIRWCTTDADGVQTTTGYSAVVIDEETGVPTTYFFDTAMAALAAAPAGEACIPVVEEPCFPIHGCNTNGEPVTKFITKDGTIVSEFADSTLGFGECVCPAPAPAPSP